jgi:hypothetical protein
MDDSMGPVLQVVLKLKKDEVMDHVIKGVWVGTKNNLLFRSIQVYQVQYRLLIITVLRVTSIVIRIVK